MFSWSKKKDNKRRGRSDRDSEENEFGIKLDKGPDDKQLEAELKRLAGVDSIPEDDLNVNEGEEDVETELLRLIGGGKGKRPLKKFTSLDEPVGDISELTADIDLENEDIEVDENDPELLGELLELTNPGDSELEEEVRESDSESESKPSNGESDVLTVLKERLKLYKTAEAKAKENNESSRARRFARGIKTLEDLLKKAKAGKAVSPNDIPPVIALNLKPAPPPQPEAPLDVNGTLEESEDLSHQFNSVKNEQNADSQSHPEDILKTLRERLELYQTAEAKAKENNETTRARRFGRGIKSLENLIKQAQAGNQIAPEDIPPAVALNLKPAPPLPVQPAADEDVLNADQEQIEDETESNAVQKELGEKEPTESEDSEKSIMDVLSERLQMYKAAETKAKEAGETSRARRFNRGIKILQDLIKQATAGKQIAPDEIPPAVALNLKPAPPIQNLPEEEEPQREPAVERERLVRSSDIAGKPLSFVAADDIDIDEELAEEETPTTVLEGLEQRVRLYSSFQEKAREEGNLTLAHENEQVTRAYLDAIKTYKKGGYVDVEKLPNPRGCPPIPIPFFVP